MIEMQALVLTVLAKELCQSSGLLRLTCTISLPRHSHPGEPGKA